MLFKNEIGEYLKEIRRFPLLSPKEERKLVQRAKKGDKDARQELITSNLRWVVKIASKYEGKGVPLPDLIQEGNIGLMQALDHFQPEKGNRFLTYATDWIKQRILRAIGEGNGGISLPSDAKQRVEKYRDDYFLGHGKSPPPEKMAKDLSLSSKSLLAVLNNNFLSLDQPIREGEEELTWEESMGNEKFASPVIETFKMRQREILEESLKRLNEREREVLTLRYGLRDRQARTLQEVGRELDLSREWVRQVEKKAIEKIRAYLTRKRIKLKGS